MTKFCIGPVLFQVCQVATVVMETAQLVLRQFDYSVSHKKRVTRYSFITLRNIRLYSTLSQRDFVAIVDLL